MFVKCTSLKQDETFKTLNKNFIRRNWFLTFRLIIIFLACSVVAGSILFYFIFFSREKCSFQLQHFDILCIFLFVFLTTSSVFFFGLLWLCIVDGSMLEVINATRVRLFINSNSSSVFSLFMPTERVRSKKKFDCISEFFVSHNTSCSSCLMLFNKPRHTVCQNVGWQRWNQNLDLLIQ